MTKRSDFAQLKDALVAQGADVHPSELHGMLIGYLCAVKDSAGVKLQNLLVHWLDGSPSKELQQLLDLAYRSAAEELDEYSDFAFRLLLPADDEAIQSRSSSLAVWCGGFLSGFGEAGRQGAMNLGEDVAEAFQDFARIAAVNDEVPDSEENEVDFAEIEEYVRVSILLIFAEVSAPSAH
jgi:uncharacterized protein YgfB (UPF0149 family)